MRSTRRMIVAACLCFTLVSGTSLLVCWAAEDRPDDQELASLRKKKWGAAAICWDAVWKDHLAGRRVEIEVTIWSKRLMEAKGELTSTQAERAAFAKTLVARMVEFEKSHQARYDARNGDRRGLALAQYARAEAEIWLMQLAPREEADEKDDVPSLRRKKLVAASAGWSESWKTYAAGRESGDQVYDWSRRLLEVDQEIAPDPSKRVPAMTSHLDRMIDFEKETQTRFDAKRLGIAEMSFAQFARCEAEIWLKLAKGGKDPKNELAALRKKKREAAETQWKEATAPAWCRGPEPPVHELSIRWLRAEQDLSPDPSQQLAALKSHLERMTEDEKLQQARFDNGRIFIQTLAAAQFARCEAAIWLKQAEAKQKHEPK